MDEREIQIPRYLRPVRLYEHDQNVSNSGVYLMDILFLGLSDADGGHCEGLLSCLNEYRQYQKAMNDIVAALQEQLKGPTHYHSFAQRLLSVDGAEAPGYKQELIALLLNYGVASLDEVIETLPYIRDHAFEGTVTMPEMLAELEMLRKLGYITAERPFTQDGPPPEIMCADPCPTKRLFREGYKKNFLRDLVGISSEFPDLTRGLFQMVDYCVATSPSLKGAGVELMMELHSFMDRVYGALPAEETPLWAISGLADVSFDDGAGAPEEQSRLGGVVVTDKSVYVWHPSREKDRFGRPELSISSYGAFCGAKEPDRLFIRVLNVDGRQVNQLVARSKSAMLSIPITEDDDELLNLAALVSNAVTEAKGSDWAIPFVEE